MFGFVRKVNLFVPDSFLSMKTVKWEVLRSAPKELELRTKFLKLSNAVWMPWGTSEANISQNINILSDCWRERERERKTGPITEKKRKKKERISHHPSQTVIFSIFTILDPNRLPYFIKHFFADFTVNQSKTLDLT